MILWVFASNVNNNLLFRVRDFQQIPKNKPVPDRSSLLQRVTALSDYQVCLVFAAITPVTR